ncbi:hypothetical protein J1605_009962 [Eschrichtius robustus]|uniref:Solute carrier family 22 member 13 n=1 Tax=Eschrichtius robustus TaxID=9764 RepID=A0AB34GRE9_ESCRO|nr:hypothetical protein J1605_009962 [Eschrichtius robustus]
MAAAFVPGFELYTALRFAVATAVVGYNFSSVTLQWVGALAENSGCGPGPVHLLHGADGPRRTHPWRPELEALPDGWRCTCLPLFLYFWALPETARWLPTRGRVEEAKQPIQRVASVNKRKLSPELLSQKTGPMGNALDLFRHPQLWKVTLILFYVCIPDSLEYFGLGLKTGMGLVGILKPLVILLGEYHTALPMLIYGSLPIGAGLLCALLPETRGQTLKDTIDDLEQESCPHSLNAVPSEKDSEASGSTSSPGMAFRAARTSECVSEARPEAAESCLNTPLGTAGPLERVVLPTSLIYESMVTSTNWVFSSTSFSYQLFKSARFPTLTSGYF